MGKRLDGQTAIVTGAGRGIGRAIARELAATGANIVINYSTSADAAGELADEIREIGPNALVVHADVTDYDQVTEMVKQTIETFGQIDILVNTMPPPKRALLALRNQSPSKSPAMASL